MGASLLAIAVDHSALMVADTPPSRAGSLLQLDWVHLRNIGRLAGQLPQLDWVYPQNVGWLSGRLRWQASSHNWIGCIRKMLVGWQAAFAGKPRSYKGSVYTLRFSPLIRPSVSSPAFDLDLPAPSGGRVEAFIWGVGA